MTGSCRSWIHYINLRSAHGTQKEHMEIAEDCRKIFIEQYPSVSEALEWIKNPVLKEIDRLNSEIKKPTEEPTED